MPSTLKITSRSTQKVGLKSQHERWLGLISPGRYRHITAFRDAIRRGDVGYARYVTKRFKEKFKEGDGVKSLLHCLASDDRQNNFLHVLAAALSPECLNDTLKQSSRSPGVRPLDTAIQWGAQDNAILLCDRGADLDISFEFVMLQAHKPNDPLARKLATYL